MPDINRRNLLKSVGAASGAGLASVSFSGSAAANNRGPDINREEVSVAETGIKKPLEKEESGIVLEKASVETLDLDAAQGYEIEVEANGINRVFHEVVASSTGGESTFSYVQCEDAANVATIKTERGRVLRAISDSDEIKTEVLEFRAEIEQRALQTLERSGKTVELENKGVSTLDTNQTSAAYDRISDTTHLYVAAKLETGENAVVYATTDGSGELGSVQVMQQSWGSCVAGCVALNSTSIGWVCWNAACGSCAAQIYPACAACIACAGGVVATCAAGCSV